MALPSCRPSGPDPHAFLLPARFGTAHAGTAGESPAAELRSNPAMPCVRKLWCNPDFFVWIERIFAKGPALPDRPAAALQDFPTLRLIFREAAERRSNPHVLAGFRGCGTARVPTPGPFPAPDDSFWMSGGFPAGPGRCGVSGPGLGGDGLAAVQLQPTPGFGEALHLAAVGEDHCERDVVEAGPVRRAVARAGPAGVLAADAVPLSVIQVFDSSIVMLLFKSRFMSF